MKLSPKGKRIVWVSLGAVVVLAVLGGWFAWVKFFREKPQVFANEAEQFKYGSLGAEGERGIPYYIWLVMPRLFSDLVPGPGGWRSFG
ncbi:MAG TPA: hypothetical protein VF551_03815, partial [Chthoniobacterales bacterium]